MTFQHFASYPQSIQGKTTKITAVTRDQKAILPSKRRLSEVAVNNQNELAIHLLNLKKAQWSEDLINLQGTSQFPIRTLPLPHFVAAWPITRLCFTTKRFMNRPKNFNQKSPW